MHKLKEKLMETLYEYEDKLGKMSGGTLSTQDLEKIHKLTDTVKNIDKIEALESEDGYSEDGHYMGEGRIYGTSYARGGQGGNRGGYSRGDASEMLMKKAEEMLEMAQDPKERRAIEKFMQEIDD